MLASHLLHEIKQCTQRKDLTSARKAHALLVSNGYECDAYLGSYLIRMFISCDSLCDAEKVFDAMIERNLVTWTTLISLYIYHGERNRAFQAFSQFFHQGLLPNRVSLLTILSACKDPRCLPDGKRVHATMVCNEAHQDISIMNALVNMYGKCSTVEETRRFFDAMHTYDIISYSSMIAFYSQQYNIREVIMLSEGMQIHEITPNDVTFINILGAFSSHEVLEEARLVHIQIQCYGYEVHMSVANAIIAMYGRCWSLEDAYNVFDKIPYKDVASWNSIIGAHVEQRQIEIALRLFEEMQNKKGIFPDVFTFISLLKACTASLASENAMLLHVCICEDGLEHSLDINSSLIHAYSKCNGLQDAQKVFDRMVKRNKVSWNSIIGAYVNHGKLEVAHRLFFRMIEEEGKIPDKVTIVSILGAIVRSETLFEGKELHKFLLDHGYTIDEVMGSSLINIYGKCGDIKKAKEVFCSLHNSNVISWNAMLSVYIEQDKNDMALYLYRQMVEDRVCSSEQTFTIAIQACVNILDKQETISAKESTELKTAIGMIGKALHADALKKGFALSAFVGNNLVTMYGKCGTIAEAEYAFEGLSQSNIVSWNVMLLAYVDNGYGEAALQLFKLMWQEGMSPSRLAFKFAFLHKKVVAGHMMVLHRIYEGWFSHLVFMLTSYDTLHALR